MRDVKNTANWCALLGTIAALYSVPALAADATSCSLLLPGSDTKPSSECLACHRNTEGALNHPFDGRGRVVHDK